MAQNPGFLNTAPLPPALGGGVNPTGMNIGIPNVNMGAGAPSPNTPIPQILTPQAQSPSNLFPANTGGVPGADMSGLNSGIMSNSPAANYSMYKELVRAYGKGLGGILSQILAKGLFNPQVAQALINAMQPSRARGLNDVLGSFGAEGARFSSAAAIGTGDFESQFALNENEVLAQIFQQDQMAELGLLSNILPTMHAEQANQGPGLFSKIMAGIQTGMNLVNPIKGLLGSFGIGGGTGAADIASMEADAQSASAGGIFGSPQTAGGIPGV